MTFYHDVFKKMYKEQRWSHASLSKKSGISRQSIGKWTLGKADPTEKNIRRLARILNTPVSHISSYEDDMPTAELQDISSAVNSALAYSEITTDELHDDYNALVELATKQYMHMEQTSLIVKAVLEATPSISYVKDTSSKYVIANKQFIDNLKLNPDFNVLGTTDSDFFNKEETEKNYKEDLGVIQTGDPVNDREDYIPGSKKKKWGLISKTPILENDKIAGVLGMITDITVRKKQEKALQFLISTINNRQGNKIFYGIVDKNVNIVYTDRTAYEEILGIPVSLPSNQIEEYWLNNIVHPNDREKQKLLLKNLNFPPIREYQIIHPRKGLRWIRTIASMYLDNIMSFSEDITEEKANQNK